MINRHSSQRVDSKSLRGDIHGLPAIRGLHSPTSGIFAHINTGVQARCMNAAHFDVFGQSERFLKDWVVDEALVRSSDATMLYDMAFPHLAP